MAKMRPGVITLEALVNLFHKPATIAYAGKGAPQLERNFRGRINYNAPLCINCGMCMRDCPTDAIKIINEGSKEEKKMKAILDLGRCIFCCQCVDTCPKDSLTYSQNVDFASSKKEDLTVTL
ncbi:MAG: 4Fe-4S binding protein [Negativicutes bacterium]|nr:4Fe-4S binding protein [Negativicutes bacterium]